MKKIAIAIVMLIAAVSLYSGDLYKSKKINEKNSNLIYNFGNFLVFESDTAPENAEKIVISKSEGDFYIVSLPSFYKFEINHDGFIIGDDYKKLCKLTENEVSNLKNEGYELKPLDSTQKNIAIATDLNRIQLNTSKVQFIEDLTNLVDKNRLEANLQILEDMETRYFLHENRRDVAMWIVNKFLEYGAEEAYLDSFELSGGGLTLWNYNVIAEIAGSEFTEESIILGGHHDSIVGNVPGTQGMDPMLLAPGVDDNGSAVACALEMCKVIHDYNYSPKYNLKFTTFACEEIGLLGSNDMATKFNQNEEKIKIFINNDMVAHNTMSQNEWSIRLMPYSNSIGEAILTMDLTKEYSTLDAIAGGMNSSGSDSYSFFENGYNTVYFFETEFTPYYHSYYDLLENCDLDYYKEAVKANIATLAYFDNNPGKIENLSFVDPGAGNEILLEWSAYNGADHYQVIWVVNDEVVMQTTNTNSITVSGLTPENTYVFYVSAVVNDFIGSYQYIECVPHAVPAIPTNIEIELSSNSVYLDWSDNTELDFVGYNVYEATDISADFTLVSSLLSISEITLNADDQLKYYCVTAVDDDGNESDHSDLVKGRAITLNQGLLIVDESKNQSGGPETPTDQEMDNYYNNLFGYVYDNVYNLDTDDYSDVSLADLCAYEVVYWHNNSESFNELIYESRNEIKKYLDLGGKLLIAIQLPSSSLAHNNIFPSTYNNSDDIYSIFRISGADYNNQAKFNKAIGLNGYPDIDVDPSKAPDNFNDHIRKIESILPVEGGISIYKYGTSYDPGTSGASMENMPIALEYLQNDYNLVITTFNLYYMDMEQSRDFVYKVFEDKFGLSVDIHDNIVSSKDLVKIYPNPFNPTTSISFEMLNSGIVEVSIYNVQGEKIESMVSGDLLKGLHNYTFNGDNLSSGLYFVKIKTPDINQTFKVNLIK
ncbi:MAG: M20/M25/M40 family metallo-hydrolase [Candidatus Delongbacteria bacterium]|nr:M20/M25/M40 family metallo-hydrolase [Candidatus Delongbacteria bacterium]MBN2835889.1 M20/M25/M40 family metallo-hydrolase [Candidatus Delongbacteria bacterium]